MHDLAVRNQDDALTPAEKEEMLAFAKAATCFPSSNPRPAARSASNSKPAPSPDAAMDAALTRLVWQRAKGRCEYCQMPQAADDAPSRSTTSSPGSISGPTVASNLCLSCLLL